MVASMQSPGLYHILLYPAGVKNLLGVVGVPTGLPEGATPATSCIPGAEAAVTAESHPRLFKA
jgi:hypothetical protein